MPFLSITYHIIRIITEVTIAVKEWRRLAKKMNIANREITLFEVIFERSL